MEGKSLVMKCLVSFVSESGTSVELVASAYYVYAMSHLRGVVVMVVVTGIRGVLHFPIARRNSRYFFRIFFHCSLGSESVWLDSRASVGVSEVQSSCHDDD